MVGGSKIRIFFVFVYIFALMACQAKAPTSAIRPSSSPVASFSPSGANTLNSTFPTYTPVPMAPLNPTIATADAYRQQQLDQQRQASQTAGLLSFLSCTTRSGGGGAAGGASAAGLGNLLGCATQGLMTSMTGGLSGGLSGGFGGMGGFNNLSGSMFPNNGSMFPNNGSMFPNNGSMFPNNGSMFPNNGSRSPNNGWMDPNGRSTRPYGY